MNWKCFYHRGWLGKTKIWNNNSNNNNNYYNNDDDDDFDDDFDDDDDDDEDDNEDDNMIMIFIYTEPFLLINQLHYLNLQTW